jgi:ATP phosphoribosyltransferase
MNESLRIALPNGELRKDVVSFMGDVGFDISPKERGLLIPVANMPIEFVILRASDVPKVVNDERSQIKAGITGSDILWENGLGKDAGEEMPIYEFNPTAVRSSLYFGVSEEFEGYIVAKEERDFQMRDMNGMMLATKYVNIASEYSRSKRMKNLNILYVPGSDEAMQYVYPECVGVVGIKSTGDTIKANNLNVVDVFHDVTLRMIDSPTLTPQDVAILDGFRDKIETTILQSRPTTTALL